MATLHCYIYWIRGSVSMFWISPPIYHFQTWKIVGNVLIFSSIAHKFPCFANCLASHIFISKSFSKFVLTKSADDRFSTFDCNLYKKLAMYRIHKFSELCCLCYNLHYQFINYATCLACLNSPLIPLITLLSPYFVDFSIFFSVYLANLSLFFSKYQITWLSTFRWTLSHKFCVIKRPVSTADGWCPFYTCYLKHNSSIGSVENVWLQGIFKDKTQYATLTRMSYCQCRLRLVFSSIFKQFNWRHVGLIVDRSDLFSLTVGMLFI